MKKHAFLIIAHNNEVNLINLIKSIDFDCNDIYRQKVERFQF